MRLVYCRKHIEIHKMTRIFIISSVLMAVLQTQIASAQADQMCKPLKAFIESVKPDEDKSFEFHTIWGGSFKDSPEETFFAKRCVHNDYAPAKGICDYLVEHGAIEFSDINLKRAISCLSPGTQFAKNVLIHRLETSFSYGTDERGTNIEITYDWNDAIGAMVLKLTAHGY